MHNRTKKGRIGCKVRIHVNGGKSLLRPSNTAHGRQVVGKGKYLCLR